MSMRGRDNQRGRGFTLIELLVVIAIIGVLISLLLPAVQSAREAARRSQCTNNLAQLALAVINYHAALEVLPPGSVDENSPIIEKATGYHFGWMAQILPYVEQRAVYNAFNFQIGLYDGANSTSRLTTINTFVCPSDPGRRVGPDEPALCNYAGCYHDAEAPIAKDNHGLLFLNSSVRLEDIDDGASQTILLGEKNQELDLGWASGTRASLRNTGTPPNGSIPRTAGGGPDFPDEPIDGEGGDPTDESPSIIVGGFSSRHTGGSYCAMADGAVRFLRSSISHDVMRRLGNRADGEILSSDKW